MPLIILPKIQRENTHISKSRISKSLSQGPLYLNGRKVSIDFVVSDTYFDKSITQDLESYLNLLERRHAFQEEKIKTDAGLSEGIPSTRQAPTKVQ